MPAIVAGMANLQKQLDEVGLAFTMDDLALGARVILTEAQRNCPVDTGFLQLSAFLNVEADDVVIGFDAEYASYVEFGTYKMEAQPFLRPAIDEMELEALSVIVDSVQRNMRDITA